ncbi:MAG: hypothetical protein AAF630_03640 [Cyanobacteria bacterium P01_C01_bin.38]
MGEKSNYQLPITNYQCAMPYAQSPMPNSQFSIFNVELTKNLEKSTLRV